MRLLATKLTSIASAVRNLFWGASLNMNFAGTDTLDPRITFSRASNATVTGPDGVLGYAPHNLLTHSEQFDASVWAKTRSTVTANAAVAPDGTTTADKLVEDTNSGTHLTSVSSGLVAGTRFTYSVFAKAAERQWILISPGSTWGYAWFNASTGAVGTIVDNGSGIQVSVTALENGWYRFSISATAVANAGLQFLVTNANGSVTYTGDGVSGIYIWGAQLNVGPLQPYYPTTVKNLLGYTQEFDNAAWNKGISTSFSANAIAAPDESLTADTFTITSGADNGVYQSVAVVPGTTYTQSWYVKLGTLSASVYRFALFNNTASSFIAQDIVPTQTPTSAEWTRITYTFTVPAGCTSVRIYPNRSPSATSGTYSLWGAQLSDSASLDPYVYNPAEAPAASAYYGPRFDYDPVTLQPKGLLIEEQRTNLLLQSEDFTTTWTAGTGAPTITANVAIAPSGTSTADKLVEGTTLGSQSILQTNVLFAVGQSAFSIYAKSAERFKIALRESTSTGAAVLFDLNSGTVVATAGAGSPSPFGQIQNAGNGWYRCTMVLAQSTAANRTVRVIVASDAETSAVGANADRTGDGTSGVYIWGAQLEAGAFPTSYIPTTTAEATRAADVAVITGANFSNWYRQDEGTFYLDADMLETQFGFFRTILAAAAGTSDIMGFQVPSNSETLRFSVLSSGAVTVAIQSSQTYGTPFKVAGAYKLDDYASAKSGSLVGVDASGALPLSVNALYFGGIAPGVGTSASTHIRKIAYFPRRLTNSELQGITS